MAEFDRHDGSAAEEATLPILVVGQNRGQVVLKRYRCRWSRTRAGRIEGLQVLCRACSAPLRVRDVSPYLVGGFSCRLECRGCGFRRLACGAGRTLHLSLRMMICDKLAGGGIGPPPRSEPLAAGR
jgi:hypothetical protein